MFLVSGTLISSKLLTEEETVHLQCGRLAVWPKQKNRKTRTRSVIRSLGVVLLGTKFLGVRFIFYFVHSTESLKGIGSRLRFVTPKKILPKARFESVCVFWVSGRGQESWCERGRWERVPVWPAAVCLTRLSVWPVHTDLSPLSPLCYFSLYSIQWRIIMLTAIDSIDFNYSTFTLIIKMYPSFMAR